MIDALKFAVSGAFLWWLVDSAQRTDPDTFKSMVSEPKHDRSP